MKTMMIAAAGLIAMTGGAASTPLPTPERMAAAAYRVPNAEIDATVTTMRRHLLVPTDRTADALGRLATCSKRGAVGFRDAARGIRAIAPVWDGSVRHRALEAHFGIRSDGLVDVERICGALTVVRKAHGDTRATIASVRDAIAGRTEAARVAKALIVALPVDGVDRSGVIRTDYGIRVNGG